MKNITEIIDAYLDGVIEREQFEVLQNWIREDADHAREFLKISALHGALRDRIVSGSVVDLMDGSDAMSGGLDDLLACESEMGWESYVDITDALRESEIERRKSLKNERRKNKTDDSVNEHQVFVIPRMGLLAAMIGFIAISVVLFFGYQDDVTVNSLIGNNSNGGVSSVGAEVNVNVARVSRVDEPVWSTDHIEFGVGGEIKPGVLLELKSGLVELHMVKTGAVVLVTGPSKFKLINDNAMKLVSGKVTALVKDEKAKGFYIDTPQGRVVDYGTEFGVSVSLLGGTRAMVFKGEIGLQSKEMVDRSMRGDSIYKGYYSNIRNDGYVDFSPTESKHYDAAKFTRISKLDRIIRARNGSVYDQWYLNCEAIGMRDDLVYYFNGALQEMRNKVVTNQAINAGGTGSDAEGTIVGAEWRAGRWGNSTALKIDDADDYVELYLPGRFDKGLTMISWIKFQKVNDPKWYRAIFNSDGWNNEGQVHFQLDPDSKFDLGISAVSSEYGTASSGQKSVISYSSVSSRVDDGQWHQLATVIHSDRPVVMFYVDGKHVETLPHKTTGDLRFGKSRIGGWSERISGTGNSRSLMGRIDSLMIFKQALEGDEISEIHDMTMKQISRK